MKLFQHSNGMVMAFGFDMLKRAANPLMISWSDFDGKTWEPTVTNSAGYWCAGFAVAPEFIREFAGKVIAYQPGLCLEMTFTGGPLVWALHPLVAEAPPLLKVA